MERRMLAGVELMDLQELERFIVVAREHTALGKGRRPPPERPGAMEIVYREGGLVYRDSYFGGNRLIGQEIVRRAGTVVWGMSYLMVIHELPLAGSEVAGFMQRARLARYREHRLLGSYDFQERGLHYKDRNEGDLHLFHGETQILYREDPILWMYYRGGTVR
jgi:hypothetical protein